MRFTPTGPQLSQMLHVVILRVVVEDTVVGGFTFVLSDGVGSKFILEVVQVLGALYGVRRRKCWSADLVEDSVVGLGVVD